MSTVAELLSYRQPLESVSDSAALDIELLLSHCLNKPRSYLRAWPDAEIDVATEEQFIQLFERRLAGEPIAYLLGEQGFWTLDLNVSSATLIPRPETELLVEKALELFEGKSEAHVLDLGTGTGAIALALASEKPRWQLSACDVEPRAVELAESNRKKLGLNNVKIIQSDWFDAVKEDVFDLIVSNPPYIDEDDIHLQEGDVRFEPRSALIANKNGMADIEHIVSQARAFMRSDGWLMFEHGFQQGEQSRQLLHQAGFSNVFTELDLAGLDRISGGQYVTGESAHE